MEDSLNSLSKEEIIEFLYINLIEKSKKLRSLKDRLTRNSPSSLDAKLKEKFTSCEEAAKKNLQLLTRK